ncbi:MAG: lysozyme inhibitor LprI family protein [Deltaproteobacteria bacterium]|jgi:uncharacterized protein YecT (DUF1311 family)|nr:lysozyme inhibitor LprI family protein [Deltaproteobacteria bacterium]
MKTYRRVIFFAAWCAALAVLLGGPPRALADSVSISRQEWTAFLAADASLREADASLNAAYRILMNSLTPEAKSALIGKQRAWLAERNRRAAPFAKGSGEYLAFLAKATREREVALREIYPAAFSPKTRQQAEPKTEPKPTPIIEPKPTPRTEPKPAPIIEPKPAPRTEPKPAPIIEPKPTPKAEPKPAPLPPRGKRLPVTAEEFAASYTQLTRPLNSPPFPAAPASVTGSGNNRTARYRIGDGISLQFKYGDGQYDRPEIITFLAHEFTTGTARHRDETAYALAATLKTLTRNSPRDGAAREAEIAGFMRSLNNAFSADASRIWKYEGMVCVVTYMQRNDLFAMVITVDEGRK